MAQTTQGRGATAYAAGAIQRPGWVTFAAVISFVVGAFYALAALSEFSNSYWFYSNAQTEVYNLAGSHLLWWGIFDTVIAVVSIVAAFSLLRGGFFGLVIGFTGAGFSAVRWLFYIPAAPWLAMTIVALSILVLYALASSVDFFADTADMDSRSA